MKKVLIVFMVCLIISSLVGCAEKTTISVNVENKDELSDVSFGKSALIEIGDGLWYDSTTRIVYWWNGHLDKLAADFSTTPSPYYAPNGLPYRYNPETNTFEEIDNHLVHPDCVFKGE